MAKKLSDLIGQFTTIPNSFIQQSAALSTEAKWLFVILRYHTNTKTGSAFPSYTKFQEITGFHRKTIAKSLKELEVAGWLTKQRRFGATTIYTLQIPSSFISDTTADSSSLNSTISSSISATISSSHGVNANQIEEPDKYIPPFSGERFLDALSAFVEHRRETKKPLREQGIKMLYRDLADWGEDAATQALHEAVRGGYQGVFRPKSNNGYHPNSANSGRLIV